jgi:hypothetical protein
MIVISLSDYIKNSITKYSLVCYFFLIAFFFFIFIAGGRYEVSGDWRIYKIYFESAPKFGDFYNLNRMNFYFEFGFLILTSIIKLFTSHFIIYFLLIEVISCILLFNNINYYLKQYKLTALCVYFSYFFISLDLIYIRSLLAVQLFLFSLKYIYKEKFIQYFIIIFIATSIHMSSAILFPLYFVLNKYYKSKIVIIIISGGIILTLSRFDILTLILRLMPMGKAIAYLESEAHGSPRLISFTQIEYLIFFIFLIKHRKKLNQLSSYFNIYFNMYLIYGILLLYFFGVNAFSGRLKFFFIPVIMFLIPYFIKLYKKYFTLALFIYFIYLFIVIITINMRNGLVYKNYFLL